MEERETQPLMIRRPPGTEDDQDRSPLVLRGGRSPNSQRSFCCRWSWWGLFRTIAITVLVFVNGYALLWLAVEESHLRAELDTLRANQSYTANDLAVVRDRELAYEKSTDQALQKVSEKIHALNTTTTSDVGELWVAVNRLSNGTSNADVLDRLRTVQREFHASLKEQNDTLTNSLDTLHREVSQELLDQRTQFLEDKEQFELLLSQRIEDTTQLLNATTDYVTAVRANTTAEIADMHVALRQTVGELSNAVDTAQANIHAEVSGVRETIQEYVAVTNAQFAAESAFVKYQLAGAFTLLSCLIFLWHLTSHVRHYNRPEVQRRIMAVLWMVPVYGVTSWVSMIYPRAEGALSALRDCFEAYVVYTFVGMLVAILSDGRDLAHLLGKLRDMVKEERAALQAYETFKKNGSAAVTPNDSTTNQPAGSNVDGAEDICTDVENAAIANPVLSTIPMDEPKIHVTPPCGCGYSNKEPAVVATNWLYQCQLLAIQFVIAKPLLTLIPFLLSAAKIYDIHAAPVFYDNHRINWMSPRLYLLIAENVSVCLAFYGLLSFYHGVEADLAWCAPWPKFLCIKAIVFATFWQYFALQTMASLGYLDESAASQIQNLLICVEMLAASISHVYVFPYQEWMPDYKREKQRRLQLRDTVALGDFVRDMRMMVTPWEMANPRSNVASERGSLGGNVDRTSLGGWLGVDRDSLSSMSGFQQSRITGSPIGWRSYQSIDLPSPSNSPDEDIAAAVAANPFLASF